MVDQAVRPRSAPARFGSVTGVIGRIPILDIEPTVACGRWPAKAVVGEEFPVAATVFREGHGVVRAAARLVSGDGESTTLVEMTADPDNPDRFRGVVSAPAPGCWQLVIEAWADPLATWWHTVSAKHAAGQDLELDCAEGALLLVRAADGVPAGEREVLLAASRALGDPSLALADRLGHAAASSVADALAAHPLRDLLTCSPGTPVWVDRERALVGAWYEFFPRSEGPVGEHGSLRTAARRLPAIAAMGFDVVYLPPIHPIGRTARKGPGNTLQADPGDPGSPWAIGSAEGGHDSVHPQLGTLADFDAFVSHARELDLEVALDFALQASPDHPWIREHPEWFRRRPDGSFACAENPPKVYQDIVPLDFETDPEGIYQEVLRVIRLWMSHGVRIFRVDNPHTKPLALWERLIWEIKASDPDVLFLAEAFTRPAVLHALAAAGFSQSYTYFTWRNTRAELEAYLFELTSSPSADYLRPNLFVNTPDILTAYLADGGPPAFKIRAVLAATAGPTWGVYSGFELCERTPARPGSEEYRDSEKYQIRHRAWHRPDSLAPFLTHLNTIRRAHPALQRLRGLKLHGPDNPEVLCFSRTEGDDTVIVVVNLDPHHVQEATVWLDMPALGCDWAGSLALRDEITGAGYTWGHANYVRLDPFAHPAHVFAVEGRT